MMNPRYLPEGLWYLITQDGNWVTHPPNRVTHTPMDTDHQARKGHLGSLPPQPETMVQDHQTYPRYLSSHLASRNPQVVCHQVDRHHHHPGRIGGHRPDTRRHQDRQTLQLHGFSMQPTYDPGHH